MEVGFIGLTVAKVSMTTAALSLAYTCLEELTNGTWWWTLQLEL